jgi:hypothetical protein
MTTKVKVSNEVKQLIAEFTVIAMQNSPRFVGISGIPIHKMKWQTM